MAPALAFALISTTPSLAQAQTFLTPYAGATFGADAPDTQFATGASLTFMGNVAGFEIDFGYAPDFFNQETDFVLIADSNVTSFMGNLVVGPSAGPVRPYGLVGLGLLRARIDATDLFDDLTTNDFAFDAGFGVLGMISPRVGLRGDVRYFRSLQDAEDDDDLDVSVGGFDFWRATGGLTFRF
jgi:hypothetical protein